MNLGKPGRATCWYAGVARKARYGTIQTFSKICYNYGLLLLATESSRPAIQVIFDRRENENSYESATRKGQIVFAKKKKN